MLSENAERENAARADNAVWFPSKVDTLVGLLLAVPPLSAMWTLLGALRAGHGLDALLVYALMPVVLILVIYGALLFPVTYGITGDELIVRSGWVRARVPLERILAVVPTHAPWSAPALSLNRLEVSWGPGRLERTRISPRERDRFLELLAARTGLERHGDALEPGAAMPGTFAAPGPLTTGG